MVLVGFECEESFKRAILKKSKASGLSLSEYLRRLVAKDLKLEYGVQYMTRQEVEELIDFKLLKSSFKKEEIKPPDEVKPEEPIAGAADFKMDLNDPRVQKALLHITRQLNKGIEPPTYATYKILGISKDKKLKDQFGKLLGKKGIKTKDTTISGKGLRVYQKDDLETFYNLLNDKNKEKVAV